MRSVPPVSEQGSVTLEYILVLGIAIPFLVFWLTLFEPGKGYTETGVQFIEFFQRILTGISLPIP